MGKNKSYFKGTKEELIQYYVIENHSQSETASHFNCGIDALYNYCKKNNIKKERNQIGKLTSKTKVNLKEDWVKNINKEELISYINSKLYSKKEIASKLGININKLETLLKIYKLKIKPPYSKKFRELILLGKETIYFYYIIENHTLDECLEKFNSTRDVFLSILKYFNIYKNESFESVLNRVTEEDLYNYYVSNNHSREETKNYFNLNEDMLYRLLDYYNFFKKESLDNLTSRISKEELLEYYNSQHSYKDTADHFNIRSIWTLYYLLNYYHIDLIYGANNSQPNLEFKEILDKNNIKYEREFKIDKLYYDFKVEDNLIEINPIYSHNSTIGFRDKTEPLPPQYHFNKTKLALSHGYRCIHIWDWDDREKIANLLKPRETIYARKCVIKELKYNTEAKNYCNKYHLQGWARCSIIIGLYYNNELVSIMTFGKPRYNKHYEWELIRYCSSKNVIGGAEKLFKYFLKNYSPKSIISYCDNSKFKGDIYTKLGFKLKTFGTPNKHWYNENLGKHITNNLLLQRGFDQLFHTNYGKGTSNEELMKENNFLELYDCGQSVYYYENREFYNK